MNAPLILDDHGNLIDSQDVQGLARSYTAAAIGALAEALGAEQVATRIAAANALLDRGWGKPTQAVEAEVKHVVDVGSFDRIAAKLQRALAAAQDAEVPTVQ